LWVDIGKPKGPFYKMEANKGLSGIIFLRKFHGSSPWVCGSSGTWGCGPGVYPFRLGFNVGLWIKSNSREGGGVGQWWPGAANQMELAGMVARGMRLVSICQGEGGEVGKALEVMTNYWEVGVGLATMRGGWRTLEMARMTSDA
jgi:hypothetical protein